jgi:lipid II:glycine glycyltransferase (peptidoglycan interpeptide bridge formation enzyme)
MSSRKNFFAGFEPEDYKKIQKILPDSQKLQVFICKFENKVVAALIISAMGNKAIYHAGATTTYGLKYYGSFLLHWKVIQWLKENNISWYDLCGINPKSNPGGYQFKTGLSGIDTNHIGEFEAYPNLFIFFIFTLINDIRKTVILLRKYLPRIFS